MGLVMIESWHALFDFCQWHRRFGIILVSWRKGGVYRICFGIGGVSDFRITRVDRRAL